MLELYNDQLIDLLADKKKGETPPPLAIKLVFEIRQLLLPFSASFKVKDDTCELSRLEVYIFFHIHCFSQRSSVSLLNKLFVRVDCVTV